MSRNNFIKKQQRSCPNLDYKSQRNLIGGLPRNLHKMVPAIIFLLCSFIFASCQKDNRAARKMDGVWKLNNVIVDSVYQPEEANPRAFSFHKCVPESETCRGKIINYDYSETEFSWIVIDNGSRVSMNIPQYTGKFKIDTLERKKMILRARVSGAMVIFRFSK